MFDFIRNHQKLMQFVLLLFITPAFVLFGLEGYKTANSSANAYAKVGPYSISPEEFDQAKRNQIEEARAQSGGSIDPKLFDTPEVNNRLLESLIFQQLIQQSVNAQYLKSSDAQVREQISKLPAFQQDGKFSLDAYKALLGSKGLSQAQYESDVRFQLASSQVLDPLLGSVFLTDKLQKNLTEAQLAGRVIQYKLLDIAPYLAKVKPSDEQVNQFYESNKASFMTPESVDVAFVILSPDDIKASIVLTDAEIAAYYEQNKSRFAQAEERRVRHILFASPKDSEADLKTQAEKVLADLKANPAKFAELAKKYSNDTGSAAEGGDVGFFGKTGAMVPEFEQAAFAQKKGELALVKTQFGFHILEVTDIRGGNVPTLEAMKTQLQAEIRTQKATAKIADAQGRFTELVYEGGQSFDGVEKAFALKSQTFSGLTKTVSTNVPVVLKDAKVLSELFSEQSLQGKNNIKAVQVGQAWVSARVLKHVPAAPKALVDVKTEIVERLKKQEALDIASKEAGHLSEALNAPSNALKNPDLTGFTPEKTISVLTADGVPRPVAEAAFKVNAAVLPKAQVVDLAGEGYAVLWVSDVAKADAVKNKVDPQMFKFYENLSTQSYQKALFLASRDVLKKRIEVDIKKKF